ncbi:TIGR00153 family protein [Natronoarchaeum philippinense]|uniref:TIGR00153 family protein n=1 Tax=Natronoarchaeum philippinense TaxID=558529 RepID=A0A285NZI7_NATPI|nr:DUF47 family protein [Natronoarchaeum philippinense]SNZ13051.1 TIGR00153 family protein [Natronoarchaeum philippinense]
MESHEAASAADPTRLRAFVESVRECVGQLPTLLSQYRGDDEAFEETVAEIDAIESQCDATVRSLRHSLVSGVDGATNAGTLQLLDDIDRIVSRTERFAKELAAIRPALPVSVAGTLLDMARATVEATEMLVGAIETRWLQTSPDDIGGQCQRVRTLERECDERKYELLERLFGDPRVDDPKLLKEFVTAFDEIPNAVEDAADRLLYVPRDGW